MTKNLDELDACVRPYDLTIHLRWNILVSAFSEGQQVMLDHMNVLEADHEKIVVGDAQTGRVNMTFRKSTIGMQGVAQITDFEINYLFDNNEPISRPRTTVG